MTAEVVPAGATRPADLPPTPPTGLTDAEAEARRAQGLGNTAPLPTTRTYTEIVRENVFTFVNNVLFLLGAALVIVGRPLDALVSLAVVSTNIVVGIVQEIRAKRTLDRIALLTRPTARVVREGKVREVSPDELVIGDLVEADPGDQVVVDGNLASGRMEVDESQLTGESDLVTKRPGDPVYSGSFSASGTARYVATTVGAASLAGRITAGARAFRRTLTPLQREIQGVIRITLAIVVYLELLLIVDGVLKGRALDEAIIGATVLVGLIPNGLFVSIAIAYALAAVRMARLGALVQQANAVESLSHVDVLCVDKTGTLTANRLMLEAVLPLGVSEAEARAALGAMVTSATAHNKTSEAIAEALPPVERPVVAEVPFSSARKWSAVSIEGPGSPGGTSAAAPAGDAGDAGDTGDAGDAGDAVPGGCYAMGAPTFLKRWLEVSEAEWKKIEETVHAHAVDGLRVLLAAHHPEGAALVDSGDASTLPSGMRPFAIVVLRDVLRPDASETLARFRELGVSVRVISGDDPETVASLAKQVGLDVSGGVVSGPELAAMDEPTFQATTERTTIFGRITPDLKERLVATFRRQGRYVAMTGDGVNDVLSLKRANLAIAMGSGSQATRGVADLVLLDDGFDALAAAVGEGQRILNGMQDILKVFLTRIMALGLLIVSSLVIGHFPVDLRNASAITLFTVGIPTALLAIWAMPGRFTREPLPQTLARFVAPAASLSSLLGLLVFLTVMQLGLSDAVAAGGVAGASPLGEAVSRHVARTAVTSFLVYTGIVLLLFVQPPHRLLAVIDVVTPDRRPTILAAALTIAYTIVLLVPPLRSFFALAPLGPRDLVIVAIGVVAWTGLVWVFWRYRVVERFLGVEGPPK
jgi:cation-transporting P-type ATPase E